MKIQATILADSICTTRLTTFLVTAPRIILAEINTHCMLPKNSASSRAIPVEKRIKMVREDPFVPTYLGANRPGMQAVDPLEDIYSRAAKLIWQDASNAACHYAGLLSEANLHKQLANRLLEPFSWVTTVVSGTEWGNFFNLRIHEDAQPEFFELAGQMLYAYAHSRTTNLSHGEWHVPFGDRIPDWVSPLDRLKVSAARCARLSYEAHDRPGVDEETIRADLALFKRLEESGHASPFQHQAQAVCDSSWWADLRQRGIEVGDLSELLSYEKSLWDGDAVWWGQFKWWRMFRKTLPGENRPEMDQDALLAKWREVRMLRGYE